MQKLLANTNNPNEEFNTFIKSKNRFSLENIRKKLQNYEWEWVANPSLNLYGTTQWSPTGPITPKTGTILTAGTAGHATHEAVQKRYEAQKNYNLSKGRSSSLMDETQLFIPSYSKAVFSTGSSLKTGPGMMEFLKDEYLLPYTSKPITSFAFSTLDFGNTKIKTNKNRVFNNII